MEPHIVEFEAAGGVSAFVAELRDALRATRLVVTRGVSPFDNPQRFWDEVTESLGTCVLLAEDPYTGEKKGEKWMEIRYDPAIRNAYRHSREAQPLHTDGSYLRHAPEIISFYCLKQASSGGQTVFIDGPELVAILGTEAPALLDELASTPVTFSKADDRKTRPIIDQDQDLPRLTWNYFTVDLDAPPAIRDLAERFHRFLQERIVAQGRLREILLQEGDAVFFHDERVLHGRNAFDARDRDDRFLWKTGFTLAPV